MTIESTSKVHGHWPVKYIKDRGRWVLHAESSELHTESSCILHAKEFLLYVTWPLIVTLLRVWFFIINDHDDVQKAEKTEVPELVNWMLRVSSHVSLTCKMCKCKVMVNPLNRWVVGKIGVLGSWGLFSKIPFIWKICLHSLANGTNYGKRATFTLNLLFCVLLRWPDYTAAESSSFLNLFIPGILIWWKIGMFIAYY